MNPYTRYLLLGIYILFLTRMASGNPEILKESTQSAFNQEGFPEFICKAFQYTSNSTGFIVMSRVPGKSCLTLIEEGHAEKGFFLKSKSCNWGPMAGFVCQLPPFNKYGMQEADYNTRKTYGFWRFFQSFQSSLDSGGSQAEVFASEHKKNVPFEDALSPFIGLRISDQRKREILENPAGYGISTYIEQEGSVYGVCHSQDGSVYSEFWMKSGKGGLWSIHHGDIYILPSKNAKWRSFGSLAEGEKFFPYYNNAKSLQAMQGSGGATIFRIQTKIIEQISSQQGNAALYQVNKLKRPALKNIKRVWAEMQKVGGKLDLVELPFMGNREVMVMPVLGTKNQFPSYTNAGTPNRSNRAANTDYYKNAVTGDYDLMAVWPQKEGLVESDIARLSEGKTKRFSISSGGTYIEVIPSGAELMDKAGGATEDPRFGNITENTLKVAGLLNSSVAALRGTAAANVAFHSDECGRPGIEELDLPVAVFIPIPGEKAVPLADVSNYRRTILRTRADFLNFALFAKENGFQTIFNGVWVYDLVKTQGVDGTQAKIQKLFQFPQNPDSSGLAMMFEHLRDERSTKCAADVVAIEKLLGIK